MKTSTRVSSKNLYSLQTCQIQHINCKQSSVRHHMMQECQLANCTHSKHHRWCDPPPEALGTEGPTHHWHDQVDQYSLSGYSGSLLVSHVTLGWELDANPAAWLRRKRLLHC